MKKNSDHNISLVFDGIRTVSVVLGAIILFVAVQHPESLLKKDSIEEKRALERAKLALEILKETDPTIRAESFMVLRTVWGNEDDWIKTIECKAVIEAGYFALAKEANAKAEQYEKEIHGLGESKMYGKGPEAARLKKELSELIAKRDYYKAQLKFCGFFKSGGGF